MVLIASTEHIIDLLVHDKIDRRFTFSKHCYITNFNPKDAAIHTTYICFHRVLTSPFIQAHLNRGTAFSKMLHVYLAKTQISLRIRPVRSESLQGTLWVVKDPKRLQEDRDDSDQSAWKHRLIRIFAGHTCSL